MKHTKNPPEKKKKEFTQFSLITTSFNTAMVFDLLTKPHTKSYM
uniref:Uncharacterized protein n=1 Tax=Rhizophora mucronata TaxID=61149 RepID=A0A2P2PQ95_RHIMU